MSNIRKILRNGVFFTLSLVLTTCNWPIGQADRQAIDQGNEKWLEAYHESKQAPTLTEPQTIARKEDSHE